jgi:uncharacterized membrane protein
LHDDRRRLEASSDGVITIVVQDIKAPQGDSLNPLLPLLPAFLTYTLSFAYLGIYWNNHHHLLHGCTTVTGATLWTNPHLLFWLSLLPCAEAIFVVLALTWLIPDRRIEHVLARNKT